MENEKLTVKEELLFQKMSRLQKKQKMLKEKERKIQARKLIKSGEIVTKAGLDQLEPAALLGALLEIQERAKDEKTLQAWLEKGNSQLIKDRGENTQRLIISFDSELSRSTKAALKDLKFKWHSFRREWYGYGNKEALATLFKGQNATIAIMD